jgi:hypothetical protein
VAHLVSEEDENNGKRIGRASNDPRGGHCQDKKNDMDGISSHQERLLLFLMTIPVELLFVFVLSHFFPAFLDHASHDLPPFYGFRIQTLSSSPPFPSPTRGEGTKG